MTDDGDVFEVMRLVRSASNKVLNNDPEVLGEEDISRLEGRLDDLRCVLGLEEDCGVRGREEIREKLRDKEKAVEQLRQGRIPHAEKASLLPEHEAKALRWALGERDSL